MSDYTDQTSAVPPQEPAPEPTASKGRGGVIAIVASVVAVVVIAGGGFAAWRFFAGGGPRPAEVLPSSTFALLAVDFDPSGGQKIEAIKTLRKLPTFREETGVRPDSDVIKAIWDKTIAQECKSVDYADDIKPWIGQRAAFGGVELEKGDPLPVVVVQSTDNGAAEKGFAKLADCVKDNSDEDFGYTLIDDYVVVSDSTAHAMEIAEAGAKSSLADEASYQKWTEEAGGAGILNGFVSKRGGEMIKEELGSELDEAGAEAQKRLDEALEKFQGAGMTLRFADSGLELAFAGGGDTSQIGDASVGDHVDALPADTAALFALAVDGDKVADQLQEALDGAAELFGGLAGAEGDPLEMVEQQTGLQLPDDLVTLLGDSLSISVGGDAPSSFDDVRSPADLPIGYLVRGDEAKVQDIVDRVEQTSGLKLADIPASFETGDGKAVLATNDDYAKQLLDDGSLGGSETFKDVVPEAGKSPFVFYLSLDNDWKKTAADAARNTGDKDAREIAGDIEALNAFGVSAWTDGDTGHALLRLTLK